MMYYLESKSNDPYFNLALEQVVFDHMDRAHSYFMLWQNDNTVVVGKHQNTAAEVNAEFIKEHKINVVRRLSGGGAVYHDMGNLNFTFVMDKQAQGLDFAAFCGPVIEALAVFGVKAELSGRNDMTIDGKKFSGNSQYAKQGRVMHHGTLLYDSDLSVISKSLNVSKDKIESKGIASVRSRVTNIKPYMREDIPVSAFKEKLCAAMAQQYNMQPLEFTAEQLALAKKLRDELYSQWSWNYGASPPYKIQKERRIEGVGKIQAGMEISSKGVISALEFHGDFFSSNDPQGLCERLCGVALEENALKDALAGADIGLYFNNLDTEGFIRLMLQ